MSAFLTGGIRLDRRKTKRCVADLEAVGERSALEAAA